MPKTSGREEEQERDGSRTEDSSELVSPGRCPVLPSLVLDQGPGSITLRTGLILYLLIFLLKL